MRRAITVVAALAALLLPSAAQALTRPEYATQADAICTRQIAIQKQALKQAFKRARSHEEPAGDADARFLRHESLREKYFAKVIDGSIGLLRALPPPPGDELIIAQWLDSLGYDAGNARAVARAAGRRPVRIGRYFAALDTQTTHSQATDLLVDGFGMSVCASPTYYSAVVSAGHVP